MYKGGAMPIAINEHQQEKMAFAPDLATQAANQIVSFMHVLVCAQRAYIPSSPSKFDSHRFVHLYQSNIKLTLSDPNKAYSA
jgi:hypothetical protein